jgi:hypothetical protein
MRLFKFVCILMLCVWLLTGCIPSVEDTQQPPKHSIPQRTNTPLPENPSAASEKPSATNEKPSATSEKPKTTQQTELQNPSPDGQGVLYFTVMVHLEGWDDANNEDKFIRHAQLLREYADIFESYGAKLTLESKEFTAGCIKWNDNVLLELEQRGHGIGVHADIGGSKRTTQRQMNVGVQQMKQELESLGVTVRHISGVCSDKDWVSACLDAGYEAATGTVSYGLWSLNEANRPDGFEPYENPGEGHAPYPWDDKLSVLPWYAANGAEWIFPAKDGLLIIPSGISLTAAHEDITEGSNGAGTFVFDSNDIDVWRQKLDEILTYTDSNKVNTYYAAYSFGSPLDIIVLEKWLKLIDEYVQDGRIVWSTIPEMIDLYYAE